MWFKRIISLILVTTLLFGMMPVSGSAAEAPEVDTGDVTIEGTNGFGNLLSQAIAEEQAEVESEYDAGYTVTDLEIEGNVATVTYDAMEEAILIVALYSEDGMQMLTSGKTTVSPDATEATVTIEGTMPEYFLASAYLVDSYDYSPLCEAYDTPMYTREMQELLASTIHDYDPDRVMNLDESEETNFAVYAEDVIRVDEVQGVNIVATCDDDNLLYIIENADETFTSLKPGDVVSYPYGEDDLLLAKISSITITGTTVTIVGDENITLEEIFDYVKVELLADNSDLEEIDSVAGESVQQSQNNGIITMGDKNTSVEVKPIRYEFVGEETECFDGYVEVLLENKMDFFIAKGDIYYRWELIYSITANFQVEASNDDDDKEWVIPILKDLRLVNIAAFGIVFSPEFVFKASGTFTVNTTFMGSIGINCSPGKKPINISTPLDLTDKIEMKGELFVGFDLRPGFYVLHEKVFYIEMGVPVGITVSAEIDWETEGALGGLQPEIHECKNCIKGEIYLSASIDVEIKLFNKKNIEMGATVTKKFLSVPFYWSITYGELDWGNCPHKQYLVTVKIVDMEDAPVADVHVAIGEMGETTNEVGIARVYLPAGSHSVSVTYNGQHDSWKLSVKSEPTKMKIILDSQDKESVFDEDDFGDVTTGDWIDHGPVVVSGSHHDNVTWTLYESGLLKISGKGKVLHVVSDPYSPWEYPWSHLKYYVKTVVIEDGLMNIPERAFQEFSNMTSVTIGDSVKTIGDSAFEYCSGLTNVTIPDSVETIGYKAFSSCSGLKNVTIPDSVKTIGYMAFSYCSGLKNVTIPDSVETIGDSAFFYCYSLTNVTIPDSVKTIGDSAFSRCSGLTSVMIPDSVKTIGDSVFSRCSGLTNVTIPDSVETIGDSAFEYCSGLSSVMIPDSVKTIGDSAFQHCYGLTNVTIPDSVETIGDRAFFFCYGLTNVTIPDSVETIGDGAFSRCSGLTNVTIPDSVETIGDGAFSDCYSLTNVTIPDSVETIGDGAFSGCSGLTNVTIPDSVETIGISAFCDCYSLTNVTIPDSVETIGNSAFFGCSGLTNVTIGDSVKTIGDMAFSRCSGLTNVTIPDSVETIGDSAFSSCSGLTNVTIPDSVETIGDSAFGYCSGLTEILFKGNAPQFSYRVFRNVTANVYYPSDNTTWTSDVMQDYHGTLTWIPYTLDEDGNMVINEATAVTVEPEILDIPVEETEVSVVQTGLEVPAPDFGEADETVNPDAVFGGDYSTEVTDTCTLKTASFTGLVPGGEYLLLAMKSIDVGDPLAADNLLYVDQAAAGEDGTLVFTYVQRETADISYVVACGASNKNLADAEITFPEMTADGELQVVEPTVVYDGETLEEGRDYTIVGTVSFTEAGTYTCYIRGLHNYTGLVECTYTVKEAEIKNFVKWVSGTTSLNGTIDLNIYVALSEDLINADDTYVRFTYAGKTVDVSMANAHHSPKGDYDNCYRFSCPVYAKQVADTVNVKFMKGDQAVGEELNYSVQQYCVNQIKKSSDAELVALCKALLNYGTAAQQMFGYNTGNSANASLSDADKALAAVDATAYKYSVTGSESGIKASSATLMLEEMVKVRVYFKLTGSKTIDEFTFTIDGKQVAIRQNEKGYYVETAGIAAKDLEKMFTIQVGGITVKYGALSYVNSKAGDTNTLAVNISKALFAYWQAAEALLG